MQAISISHQSLQDYEGLISEEQLKEIKKISGRLKGLRVSHINSTAEGGGVAEILRSLVGLMKGAGIEAEWRVIPAPEDKDFFEVTKSLHNALQGKNVPFLTEESKRIYNDHNRRIAKMMDDVETDIWIVHDPQPLGSIVYSKNSKPKKIARIHLDSSGPDDLAWNFVRPILARYDRAIFTMPEFVPKDFPREKVKIFNPAIDPFSEKNRIMSAETANVILKEFGINPAKPLVSQVSRFDPWKDPLGAIDAFYKAKNEIPDLQFALIGLIMASDDPEAIRIYDKVKKYAKGDPDIYLFANVEDRIKNLSVATFVNAFQSFSDVILAKSVREGFGLVVAEAMWKGKPVIGGNVGGIKIQIEDGKSGYLVNSSDEAAERIVRLLKDDKLRAKMGESARESVRDKFLMPRLLLDYLRLFGEIL